MAKKGRTGKKFMLIIATLFIANIALIGISLQINQQIIQNTPQPKVENKVQPGIKETGNLSILSLDGFVPVEIDLRPNVLIVKYACKGIPMTPTEQQMRSIASVLGNQTDFRPSTHDLMMEIFDTYGIEILQSKIVEAEEDDEVYYARLVVRKDDKILNLDTKPSDTMAIALRANIPIYIKQDILDKRGKDVCSTNI